MKMMSFARSGLPKVAFCCFLVSTLLATAQPTDIRQGLVAYWPLESTDGATAPDVTPFGNHLNLVNMGAENFVPGRYGNAALFNGTDEILSRIYAFGEDNGLPIYGARRYTIAMWVNGIGTAQVAADRRIFCEGSTTTNAPLLTLGTDSQGNAALRTNVVDVFIRNTANTALLNHGKSTNMASCGVG